MYAINILQALYVYRLEQDATLARGNSSEARRGGAVAAGLKEPPSLNFPRTLVRADNGSYNNFCIIMGAADAKNNTNNAKARGSDSERPPQKGGNGDSEVSPREGRPHERPGRLTSKRGGGDGSAKGKGKGKGEASGPHRRD